MICFRIYTEDKNLPKIKEKIKEFFNSATLYFGSGIYNKNEEYACIIEVIGDPHEQLTEGYWKAFSLGTRVVQFANDIKKINEQDEILITYHEVEILHD